MANIIGTKKYLTVMVFNKKTGKTESRVVKTDSSNCRLNQKAINHIETKIRQSVHKDIS